MVECDCCCVAAAEVGWHCHSSLGLQAESLKPFLVAEAASALVGCPGSCTSPVSSLVWVPEWFRGVGGFLPPVHPLFSLPSWVPPKALSKLGNIIIRVSRVVEVIAHSEGKEARKLEGSQSSESRLTTKENSETYILRLEVEKTTSPAILTWEKGFLGDFTLAGRYDSLRLLIYMHPSSFLKVLKFGKHVFTK